MGGGFGGVRTALNLSKKIDKARITLIDRNNCHLFTPALYEVASVCNNVEDSFSVALKKTIAIPFAEIFEGKNVNFVQAEVDGVNLTKQVLKTKGGHEFHYDYLVVALGSQAGDFGIPGVKEYAYQFKTIDDALMIHRKIEEMLDDIMANKQQPPLTFLICGAGFTGVELAAEISCYVRKAARTRKINGKLLRMYLFEAAPQILPYISDKERELISGRLTKLGIAIMANSAIETVGDKFIKLKNGQTISGDMVIWTAGIKPNEFLKSVNGLELTPNGKISIGEHLHLAKFKNVFAVGDNIEFIDHKTQKPIPAVAYLAIDHGKIAAKNIVNSIRGEELKIHRPSYEYWVTPVGGKYSLAHLGQGITIAGFWGWIVKELVDLRYLLSILPVRKAFSIFVKEYLMFRRNDV